MPRTVVCPDILFIFGEDCFQQEQSLYARQAKTELPATDRHLIHVDSLREFGLGQTGLQTLFTQCQPQVASKLTTRFVVFANQLLPEHLAPR